MEINDMIDIKTKIKYERPKNWCSFGYFVIFDNLFTLFLSKDMIFNSFYLY